MKDQSNPHVNILTGKCDVCRRGNFVRCFNSDAEHYFPWVEKA